MKKTSLRSKEVNKLLEKYGIVLSKKDLVVLVEDKQKIIMLNNTASFFYHGENLIPTLRYLQENQVLKEIVVDMGAVKFVINGADVMRPGIVEIKEGISKDDFIVIVDVNNNKPLAVGIALLNSEDMRSATAGKVIKNIHHVGDELWRWE